jgi:hypothetical protein
MAGPLTTMLLQAKEMQHNTAWHLHDPNILGIMYDEDYLQLSTNALASSRRESGKSAVVKSVMLKKCFSRPVNVVRSHRGASISNEPPDMMVLFSSPLQAPTEFGFPIASVNTWRT